MRSTRRIVLANRPSGHVLEDDFRLEEVALPPLTDGDIELETVFISIDPAIRGWLDDRPSYLPSIQVGSPIRAFGVARVTASKNTHFVEGDIVRGFVGWQQRQVAHWPGPEWDRITPRPDVSLEHYLGVLGMTGLTAWAGVCDILQPVSDQTVLISGASGAVGTVAVQLAKRRGARVVGIAGGTEKCEMLTQIGADVAIDRTADNWREQLEAATPNGIDHLFENTGGPMFDASIARLNNHARIALCGLIDGYNSTERPPGPRNFGMLLTKRVTVQGFIVLDYMDQANEVEDHLAELIAHEELKPVQTVLAGFDQLPAAFIDSFATGKHGKLIIDLSC